MKMLQSIARCPAWSHLAGLEPLLWPLPHDKPQLMQSLVKIVLFVVSIAQLLGLRVPMQYLIPMMPLELELLCTLDLVPLRRMRGEQGQCGPGIFLHNLDPSTDLVLVTSLQGSTTHFPSVLHSGLVLKN